MDVVVTIVTFNRKELLKECIEKLLNQSYDLFDIYIIDNASTDGTKQFISHFIDNKRIYYFNTGANLGGAGGFNYAIKKAAENEYKYIWLMDDDTMPTKNALLNLMKFQSKNHNFGFLSSRVEWLDGSLCKMNKQKLLHGDIEKETHASLCRQASFVSLFIPTEIVYDLGLPIKDFFIWGDDVEYTRRISFLNNSYYIPESVVVHKTLNNEGSNIARDNIERISRYRYAYRNEVYIAKKEGFKRMVYQFLKINYHLLKVVFTSKDNKIKKIGIILGSSIEGIKFNPIIEKLT